MEYLIINKKEYPNNSLFIQVPHNEYFNLKIYPLVGILEKEAGLLSDYAEAYALEGIKCNFIIYSSHELETVQFFNDNIYIIGKLIKIPYFNV